MARRLLQRELQHRVQKHEPVYQNVKGLHDGKGDITKKHKDGNRINKKKQVAGRSTGSVRKTGHDLETEGIAVILRRELQNTM